jgi:hypothetical protein
MEAARRSEDEVVQVLLTHPAIDVNIKSKVRQCFNSTLSCYFCISVSTFLVYVSGFVFLVFCPAMYLWVL